MIILNDRKFIETKFKNEQEIEDVTRKFSEHFFGASSIFIPKARIETYDGFATIPDGFAIDIASRTWYLVEAELSHHSLWNHIAPQVTKQLTAVSRPETSQLIAELIIEMISEDPLLQEKFEDENIRPINIRKVLAEILEKPPIIGMPIDKISKDLEQWAQTLRNDIRLWIVKKYFEFGNTSVIVYEIPEEDSPTLDISEQSNKKAKSKITNYDVSILELINRGLLDIGQTLYMSYGPKGQKKRKYESSIEEDGGFSVLGTTYSSPSYAALACIKDAGSNRDTVNGWNVWKTRNGKRLSEIRQEYLSQEEEKINSL